MARFARSSFSRRSQTASPVHRDGNRSPSRRKGRVVRIRLNAELVAAGKTRIIVPAVLRSNCNTAVDLADLDWTGFVLDQNHAFMDPSFRLPLPTPGLLAPT